MKRKQAILNQFPKYLFWDTDPSSLNVKADMNLIIPRALMATTDASFNQDISRLERLYNPHQIVDTLKNTKERISNNVCRLVAQYYHIPSFSRFSK